ncbi:hypothetical protein P7H16_16685 [Paenibacillus larvae]|nr:hypothetical protein [Paenibacillus larvae]MDT2248238.1 hypothetical protein [Paenibacillus larvae]MDT2288333.1 hypothetical protein [Paenibacillus larvae]
MDNKWGPYSEAGVDAFLLDTLDPDQQGEQGKHFAGGSFRFTWNGPAGIMSRFL